MKLGLLKKFFHNFQKCDIFSGFAKSYSKSQNRRKDTSFLNSIIKNLLSNLLFIVFNLLFWQGQWRADKYNGEGELKDISGVTYSGLWSYHVPSFNPVRLAVAIPEGTPVENLSVGDENLNLFAVTLPQGEAFTLDVSVVTADGEVVTQSQ